MGYEYEVQYKKGRENSTADALSRINHHDMNLYAISVIKSELIRKIEQSWQQDEKLQKIIKELTEGGRSGKFTWENQQLRRKKKLVVGNDPALRKQMLQMFHSEAVGGHSGILVTTKRLVGIYYWKGLSKDVRNFIRACDICQLNKSDNNKPAGLLQPIAIPNRTWEVVSMDFIEGLPSAQGKNVILVVVDKLSKYAHFLPLKHPYTAASVAGVYLSAVYKLHGMPVAIISDRDPVFTSLFWQELFKKCRVKLQMSTAYHPQSDGQTEVVNKCLENYLKCMCTLRPKEWVDWLPLAEYWYNTSFHSSLNCSPYQALYGQAPPLHVPYFAGDSNMPTVNNLLSNSENQLKESKVTCRKHNKG